MAFACGRTTISCRLNQTAARTLSGNNHFFELSAHQFVHDQSPRFMQQWRARMWHDAWSLHCRQRYFVCGKKDWKKGAPIFFYVGNEADVTLCVSDKIRLACRVTWETSPQE